MGRIVKALKIVARLLPGIIFAISAETKIAAPAMFRDGVAAFHILPTPLITPFAYVLPWIEALAALYFFLGLFQRTTVIVSSALIATFMIAIGASLVTGNINHSCGCFSDTKGLAALPVVQSISGGSTITILNEVRDALFLVLAALVYFGRRTFFSLDGLIFSPVG